MLTFFRSQPESNGTNVPVLYQGELFELFFMLYLRPWNDVWIPSRKKSKTLTLLHCQWRILFLSEKNYQIIGPWDLCLPLYWICSVSFEAKIQIWNAGQIQDFSERIYVDTIWTPPYPFAGVNNHQCQQSLNKKLRIPVTQWQIKGTSLHKMVVTSYLNVKAKGC